MEATIIGVFGFFFNWLTVCYCSLVLIYYHNGRMLLWNCILQFNSKCFYLCVAMEHCETAVVKLSSLNETFVFRGNCSSVCLSQRVEYHHLFQFYTLMRDLICSKSHPFLHRLHDYWLKNRKKSIWGCPNPTLKGYFMTIIKKNQRALHW